MYPGAQEADIRAHIHIYLVRGTRHTSAYKKHTSSCVGAQEAVIRAHIYLVRGTPTHSRAVDMWPSYVYSSMRTHSSGVDMWPSYIYSSMRTR